MSRWTSRLLVSTVALAMLPAAAASAATFNVTTEVDSNSGACLPASCTLRQAVTAANGGTGGDVVTVPPGFYPLLFGELQLQKNVTIAGAGPAATVVDGNANSRIFRVTAPGVTASISGLAVEGGRVAGTGAAQAQGGGILNLGMLTLDNVLVRGNTVQPADNSGLIPEGGGIFNAGTLHVSGSVIEDNRATTLPHAGGIPSGAGIANMNGQVDLTDSTLSGNSAIGNSGIPQGGSLSSSAATAHGASVTLTRVLVAGNRVLNGPGGGITQGGGLAAFSTDVTVIESSVTGNRVTGGAIANGAGIYFIREGNFVMERSLVANNVGEAGVITDGAGLYLNGETTEVQRIVNSTIAGNRGLSPDGGIGSGIFHFGGARLDVLSSTINANVATAGGAKDSGGNLWDAGGSGSVLSLRDSIVSGGAAASGSENCFGAGVQSAGHNIDSLDQCNFHGAGDKVNTNPLLLALAGNGGPTATLALSPGSPAIDAGDAACPATDQRAVPRPQGAACDIGAFEFVPPQIVTVPHTSLPVAPASGLARLRLLSNKVSVDLKTGKGTAAARCLNVPADRCKVALTLSFSSAAQGAAKSSRLVRIGAGKGTIAGGKTAKLRFKLTTKGLALLEEQKNQKLVVRAKGTSQNRAKQAVSINRTLTLKAKGPRGK